jgi:hypothetical protein
MKHDISPKGSIPFTGIISIERTRKCQAILRYYVTDLERWDKRERGGQGGVEGEGGEEVLILAAEFTAR